jgi:hypothetical protein
MKEGRSPGLARFRGAAAVLLTFAACARQEAPRGGEPDRAPPAVIAVRPEALSSTDALGAPIRIEFNETISERPSSGLISDAVLVSPEAPGLRVRHRGEALEVEVPGGLRPGVVYRVTLQPVIRDLFGNVMREPFEFVFSTGAELYPTAVAGLVVDRLSGLPTRDVLIHAVEEATSDPPVVHVARTDSAGFYALRYLPPGRYSLTGFVDRNRSRVLEESEPRGGDDFDLGPADTVFVNFPLNEPDSTPALISRAEVVEPSLIRITFDDFLDPDASLALVGSSLQRAEDPGGAPEVRQLLHEHRMVALRDDAIDNPPLPDTAGAVVAPPPARLTIVGRAQGADTTALSILQLTLPSRVVYAELSDTLDFSADYTLRMQGVTNVAGLQAPVDTVRVSRGDPPPGPGPPPGPP